MVKQPRADSAKETTPKEFPEVTPSSYAASVGIGHVVESMMQMQQSIGELKATVSHLTASSDKQSVKLDGISHRIYAAGAVLTVLLAIGGFFMNKIWDGVVTLMVTQQQIAPKAQAPPPYPASPKADP